MLGQRACSGVLAAAKRNPQEHGIFGGESFNVEAMIEGQMLQHNPIQPDQHDGFGSRDSIPKVIPDFPEPRIRHV
jgi:hypothetical protein